MRRAAVAVVASVFAAGAVAAAPPAQDDRLASIIDALALRSDRASDQPTDASAAAGRLLFSSDAISSIPGRSCTSCHDPKQNWTGALPRDAAAPDHPRSVPTLVSASVQHSFFWDGRATSLEAQVMEVLENPREMAGSRWLLVRRLAERHELDGICAAPAGANAALGAMSDEALARGGEAPRARLTDEQRADVDRAFACTAHAIADYIRSIPYPASPWRDIIQQGRPSRPLSESVIRGARIFTERGKCSTCHYGPYFTDGEFHNIGVPDVGGADISDPGLFGAARSGSTADYNRLAQRFYPARHAQAAIAQSMESWGAFKTPSLVGVSKRAAFMHNGRYKTLEQVVDYYNLLKDSVGDPHHYGGLLVPLNLTDQEKTDLIAFLDSL